MIERNRRDNFTIGYSDRYAKDSSTGFVRRSAEFHDENRAKSGAIDLRSANFSFGSQLPLYISTAKDTYNFKQIPIESRILSQKGPQQVINLGQHQRGMPISL